MDTLLHDLRYAARQLIKGRATTIIAVLTLALGIGANTSVFTALNATLFKSIDAPRPDRLVWVAEQERQGGYHSMSYPDYRIYRTEGSFSGMLAFGHTSLSLGGDTPERVNGLIVSGNFFDVLQRRPLAGRAFLPEEDSLPGTHPVVMVSEAFWKRRFGSAPDLVNQVITINGKPFTVIGIAPKGFMSVGLGDPVDLVLPLAMLTTAMPGSERLLTERNAGWLRTIGRLKDGVTIEQAGAAIAVLGRQVQAEVRDSTRLTRATVVPIEGGLDPSNRREAAPVFSLLMVVPALVLLVACANVASLLLARATARRREIAVRRAIGASRGRLVRQLLTESLLLSLLAGGFGVLLAVWLTAIIVRFGEIPMEFAAFLVPDGRVFLFTGLLALATTFFFGLAPALSATNPELTPSLKSEGVTVSLGRRRHRLRDVFIVAQVSVSLILLIIAGLFVQSLHKAVMVDPGFDPRNGMAVSFDLGLQGYSRERAQAFYQRVLAEAQALPGVESAALVDGIPLSGRMVTLSVQPDGAAAGSQGEPTGLSSTSPGYFHTMRIPLVSGRDFAIRDAGSTPLVAIVNETLARRLWPEGNPLGKRIRVEGRDEPLREVVGVARDGKYGDLTESPRSYLYLPETQSVREFGSSIDLVVRGSGDVASLQTPVAKLFARLDRDLPLFRIATFDELLRLRVDKQRAASTALSIFGGLALLLASLGLYGVTAHGVAVRTREIGIRVSLGARRSNVLSLFVREGLLLSSVGIGIGLLVSAALSRLLSSFLFGLRATDTFTFFGGAVILSLVAALASYLPARRAARVDPMVALRSE